MAVLHNEPPAPPVDPRLLLAPDSAPRLFFRVSSGDVVNLIPAF